MALFIGSIGVDRHEDPNIRDLTGAKRDATALWALFVDTLPEAQATLLTDQDASLTGVQDLLARTLDSAGPDDTVILSFAGHGTRDHRIVLHDTKRSDLPNTTLSMADLARRFRESRAKAVICFLDCCFSGGAPARVLEDSPAPRDPYSPLQEISGSGRILLSASNVDEAALEDPVTRHGLFTGALISALQGLEPISMVRLADDVSTRVQADAARFGHTQTPVIFGMVEGTITIPALRKGPIFAENFPEFSGLQVTSNFQSLAAYGIGQPILDQWAANFPNGLNALQLSAINDYRILDGDSLLVVAPTSAGKTFVGELAAMRAAGQGKKAVFLLPYRALVNEKYEDFQTLYGDRIGLRVARCSGDWQDQIPAILRGKYDIAFFTYETFLGLALSSPHILNQVGLVVVDEAQFISDPHRGITVELLLTYLISARTRGINPQLVLLSAVIGGTNALDDWLGCRLLISTQRPVPLTEGVIDRQGIFQFLSPSGAVENAQLLPAGHVRQRRNEPGSQDVIVPLVRQLVNDGENVLIFRNTRGSAQGCAAYLAAELGLPAAQSVIDSLPELDQSARSRQLRACLSGGTAFHSSDLKPQERIAIEKAFRDPAGPVRVLVATSTVAAGINTPASTVIIVEHQFVGGEQGNTPYTVAQYKNMAGRAGRLGFRDSGRSVLIAENGMERARLFNGYVQRTPEAIRSSFEDGSPDTWLIRLLAQGPHVTRQQAVDLLANTYGGYLASRADAQWRTRIAPQISNLIERMLANGLLEEDAYGIHLTLLGQACGQSPFQLQSALQLVEMLRRLTPADLVPQDVMAIVQATPEMDADYTPIVRGRGEPGRQAEVTQRYGARISSLLQTRARDGLAYHRRCKRALVLADWVEGVQIDQIEQRYSVNAFSQLASGDIVGYADQSRFYLQSAFRFASIIFDGQGPTEEAIDNFIKQLEIGIPVEALPLLGLPLLMTRGEYLALCSVGVRTPDEVSILGLQRLSEILGSQQRAETLLRAFGDPQ